MPFNTSTTTIMDLASKAAPVGGSPTLITVESYRRSSGDPVDVQFDVIIVGGR